jgi:hypothetical protein
MSIAQVQARNVRLRKIREVAANLFTITLLLLVVRSLNWHGRKLWVDGTTLIQEILISSANLVLPEYGAYLGDALFQGIGCFAAGFVAVTCFRGESGIMGWTITLAIFFVVSVMLDAPELSWHRCHLDDSGDCYFDWGLAVVVSAWVILCPVLIFVGATAAYKLWGAGRASGIAQNTNVRFRGTAKPS